VPLVDVKNIDNETVGQVELRDDIFGVEVKPHLMHDVVQMQLAKRRAGTVSTKGRSQVRGGGRKPYRQKGTGRARAGTIRSPLARGGGVVFGPHPRDFKYKVPKKVRRAALCSALSDKLASQQLTVLDDFTLDEIKTKRFVEVMGRLGLDKTLIVIDSERENLELSARNVPDVKVIRTVGLNVFDVLKYDHLILLKECLEPIDRRLAP
jgi:large subunit ribosomal protein L4